MLRKIFFSGVFFVIVLMAMGFGLPKNVEKRVVKEVQKAFEIDDIRLTPVLLGDTSGKQLPTEITPDNFFRLSQGDHFLGYAFVDQAPSKTAKFDYLIVFDTELRVKHSKVLIYREEYGGEIGSKRWLKQFLGKTMGDRVDHETNIDGIAGATISVRSMCRAVDNLLQTIDILHANKAL